MKEKEKKKKKKGILWKQIVAWILLLAMILSVLAAAISVLAN